ncbi:MAG TPA: hypothetical protein VFP84_07465 [Kofleriaceae bacterium]|nr:hypothetical protein [Kofleriaceae bacterium]
MEPTHPTEPQKRSHRRAQHEDAPKRRPGRPRRADAPKVPWESVRRALVFGEREVDPVTGDERVHFPSLAVLADRYGVSRTLMWKFAHKERVYERRTEAKLKAQARFEDKVIEKLADARATATVDVIAVVDQFLLRFETDLREGRVKTDSAADFDRLARLRELMSGSSDARIDLQGGLTLEAIQSRHRTVRAQVAQLTPQITGTVGDVQRVEHRPVAKPFELDRIDGAVSGRIAGASPTSARPSARWCVDPRREYAERDVGREEKDARDAGELELEPAGHTQHCQVPSGEDLEAAGELESGVR